MDKREEFRRMLEKNADNVFNFEELKKMIKNEDNLLILEKLEKLLKSMDIPDYSMGKGDFWVGTAKTVKGDGAMIFIAGYHVTINTQYSIDDFDKEENIQHALSEYCLKNKIEKPLDLFLFHGYGHGSFYCEYYDDKDNKVNVNDIPKNAKITNINDWK